MLKMSLKEILGYQESICPLRVKGLTTLPALNSNEQV